MAVKASLRSIFRTSVLSGSSSRSSSTSRPPRIRPPSRSILQTTASASRPWRSSEWRISLGDPSKRWSRGAPPFARRGWVGFVLRMGSLAPISRRKEIGRTVCESQRMSAPEINRHLSARPKSMPDTARARAADRLLFRQSAGDPCRPGVQLCAKEPQQSRRDRRQGSPWDRPRQEAPLPDPDPLLVKHAAGLVLQL